MNVSSEACKEKKKKARVNLIQWYAGELVNHELVYSGRKGLADSEGSFIDWHLSSCLQVVLYALLGPSPHNCLAGRWGKVGTIKAG